MTLLLTMIIVCVVLLLVALFFLFWSIGSFFYPQSRTTVEVYPSDMRPPLRWKPVSVQGGVSFFCAGLALVLHLLVLLPEWRLNDAEKITRVWSKERMEREPIKFSFENKDTRNVWDRSWSHEWQLSGTVWLDNGEVWDVTVRQFNDKGVVILECRPEGKR